MNPPPSIYRSVIKSDKVEYRIDHTYELTGQFHRFDDKTVTYVPVSSFTDRISTYEQSYSILDKPGTQHVRLAKDSAKEMVLPSQEPNVDVRSVWNYHDAAMHGQQTIDYHIVIPDNFGLVTGDSAEIVVDIVFSWLPNTYNQTTMPPGGFEHVSGVVATFDVGNVLDQAVGVISEYRSAGKYLRALMRASGLFKRLGSIRVGIAWRIDPPSGVVIDDYYNLGMVVRNIISGVSTSLITYGVTEEYGTDQQVPLNSADNLSDVADLEDFELLATPGDDSSTTLVGSPEMGTD